MGNGTLPLKQKHNYTLSAQKSKKVQKAVVASKSILDGYNSFLRFVLFNLLCLS